MTRTRKSDPMENRPTAIVTLSDGGAQNYADRGNNGELFSIALFYIRFPPDTVTRARPMRRDASEPLFWRDFNCANVNLWRFLPLVKSEARQECRNQGALPVCSHNA